MVVLGLTFEEKKRRKRQKELLGLTDEELDVLGEETSPEPEKADIVRPLPENQITFQPVEGVKPLPETVKLASERIPLREPVRPPQEEDLESLLERVYPEKFQPGVTSYGYTKEQLSPVVLEQAESAMRTDFKGFQYDVYQRVGPDEGEKLLRALGANEAAILQAYDANIQEQRIVNTVQAVLPDVTSLDQFQELLDKDPRSFARSIKEGGITTEKQQLLDLLGLQASEIEELLVDRIFTDVDGIRKQVIRDADNNVYDERGQWLGWYDWGENKIFNPSKEGTLNGKARAFVSDEVKTTWDKISDFLSTNVTKPFTFGTRQAFEGTRDFFLQTVPNLIFQDERTEGRFDNSPAGQAAKAAAERRNVQNQTARDKFRVTFVQAQEQDTDWLKKHPALLKPEYEDGMTHFDDPGWYPYVMAKNAPLTIAALAAGLTVAVTTKNPIAGWAAASAVFTPATIQDVTNDLLAAGVSEQEAARMALPVGLIISTLEGAGEIPVLKATSPALMKLFKSELTKEVGKLTVRQLAKKGITVATATEIAEVTTEVLQQAVQNAAVRVYDETRSITEGLATTAGQTVVSVIPFALLGGAGPTMSQANVQAIGQELANKTRTALAPLITEERGAIEIGPEGKPLEPTPEVPKVPEVQVVPKAEVKPTTLPGIRPLSRGDMASGWQQTYRGRTVFKTDLATENAKEAIVFDKITNAPSYPKLLAAYKRFQRSLHSAGDPYMLNEIREAEQQPWKLLTAHGGVMNAKSGTAKTLRSLADAVFTETKLPRLPQGKFRGEDALDWDKVKVFLKAEPKPTTPISEVKPTTTPSAAISGQGVEAAAKINYFNKQAAKWRETADAITKQETSEEGARRYATAIQRAEDFERRARELEVPLVKEGAEVPPVKPPTPPEAAVTPTPEPKPTPVQRVREFYKSKIADLEATTRDRIASLKDWANYRVEERDRVKNILTDYIQEQLPLAERGKLLDAVKNVTNQAQLDEVITRVDRLAEVAEEKRLRTEINKELAKTKPKKVEGILKGKYTAEFQDWLDTVKANIGMDRDEARGRIEELIRQYTEQKHSDERMSEESMQEQITVLRLAGIDGMSSAELQEALTDIQDMKTIGRTLNQANQEKLKADIAAIKEKAVNEVTGNKGLKPGTGVLDARELEAKTNFVGRLTDSQLAFGNLLDEISKLSGTQPYQSTLSKFERTVQEARNKENSGRKLYQQAIIQDFAKIYDLKKPGEINARLNQIENEKVDLGTFRVVVDGKAQSIHMVKTKAQIMQHYLWQQDPTLIDTYKEGMHYTYEINSAMANALNDQDVAFADSISQFYRDYYPSIDQVYKELYGVHLPNNPNYSPLLRDFDTAQPENVMLYKDLAHYASVLNGSLKSRVRNILPLHDTSVLANLINHVSQMEHFKAWSMPMRTMRRVFGDKIVRTAIQQYHGRPVMQKVDHYLDLFARGGIDRMQVIRDLDKLRGNFSTAVLGLKPHIAIQQIPTILGYTTEMPLGDFVEGVADFWKSPIQNYQWILKNSPYIQNRYEAGFERDIRTATTKKALTEWSGKGSFTEKVYALIESGDKLGVIPGWWAKYKSALKHGLNQQEAMTEADLSTNHTQNTSDIETLSSVQNGSSWMKLLTMFQNQPNKYFRIMADNARNFKYGRGSKGKAISNILMVAVVLPALYSIIANAFRVRRDDLFKTAVFSPVNNLLIFGQMAQAVEGWISGSTFGYNVSPVLDTMQEIQNAFSKVRKLVAAGQDPYKDIAIDDVVALTEFVAKAGGQAIGLPTPYLVNVERALRGTEGKRDLRELVFSRWALREPDKDVHEKLAESQGKLGQTIEYTQKQLDAMAKAGQKITPKVTDMKVLDGEFKEKLGNTLPVEITEKNGYSPMAVAWAQKEIARGQADILPNIKLKDYFKDDYDDFSPRQYVEQYQASLRIKSLQELKEYASVYPRYYLGNLTARQLEAMEKFATLSKPEQEKFLEAHPELSLNPRQEWLIKHPEENARLAVWGQAKVLTQAAYDNAIRMVQDLDIPDNAIEGYLPTKDVAADYFTYNDAVDKYGANSPQARFVRLNDKLNGWMELERIDETKKSLELKVKTYDKSKEYAAFSDKDSPNYKDDVVKDAEGKTARDKAQEAFRKDNQTWLEDLDRIEAHSKGTRDNPTPDDVVEKWTEHGKLARQKKGYEAEEKVWYLDNPTIHKWALDNNLTKDDGLKWNEPVLRIQVKPENRKMEAEREKLKGDEEALKKLMATKAGQAYQDDQNRIYAYQNNGKEFVETLVGYGKVAREFGGGSSEAKLFRFNDEKFNKWGTDRTFEGGGKWEPLDTTKVPIWKIDAEFRKEDEEYSALKDDKAREQYLAKDKDYRIARRRREAYQLVPRSSWEFQKLSQGEQIGPEREEKDVNTPVWRSLNDGVRSPRPKQYAVDEVPSIKNPDDIWRAYFARYQLLPDAQEHVEDFLLKTDEKTGLAYYDASKGIIAINPDVLRDRSDEYITELLAHEFAHGEWPRLTKQQQAGFWDVLNKPENANLLKFVQSHYGDFEQAFDKPNEAYAILYAQMPSLIVQGINIPSGFSKFYPWASVNHLLKKGEEIRDFAKKYREAQRLSPMVLAPNDFAERYGQYYELPEKGFRRERFLLEDEEFASDMATLKGIDMPDPKKIPAIQYDQIYEQYQDKFERYDNVDGTSEQRRQTREAMLKADPRFAEARLTRSAYGLLIGNEKYVPDYVRYYKILSANLDLDNYEDDWYLMEHPAFYQTMSRVLDWQQRDFSKVPSRRVWQKYQLFLTQVEGKARDDYRFDNQDLDAWLVLRFGYKSITEKRRRAEFTPKERLAEEVEKRVRRLAGIGAR